MHIGGLAESINEEDLKSKFKTFGEVLQVEIIRDGEESRGFGYISLKPLETNSLNKCMSLLNNLKWKGKEIKISPAKPDFKQRLANEWEEIRIKEEKKKADEELLKQHELQLAKKKLRIQSPSGKIIRATPPKLHVKVFPPMPTRFQNKHLDATSPPPELEKNLKSIFDKNNHDEAKATFSLFGESSLFSESELIIEETEADTRNSVPLEVANIPEIKNISPEIPQVLEPSQKLFPQFNLEEIIWK